MKISCNFDNMKRNVRVMGILNLSPDSFYEASRATSESEFREGMDRMIASGADIIDIGLFSSRPGAEYVSPEEQFARVEPYLQILRDEYISKSNIELSFDTTSSEVVLRIYDSIGPFIVNDISASAEDDDMLKRVGELSLDYIAMHMKGDPRTMQSLAQYDSVVTDVIEFFKQFEERASRFGINNYIIDPGFGFSKTISQNYELLAHLDEFSTLNREILVGISRKSMIYKLLGTSPDDALSATSALHLYALNKGASILRVHDVRQAKEVVSLYNALQQ